MTCMPHIDGTRVRNRAAQLGLSTVQLADRAGIKRGTMRNVLSGRQSLHLVRCYRLLKILNPIGVRPLVLTDILSESDSDVASA
jgi:transcriptional regulator with XRE-family HTH domain